MEQDPLEQLEAVFRQISEQPDDVQFEAWNNVMEWLQKAMSQVATNRRQALWRYYKSNELTRRDLTQRFEGLTLATASRLMDEVSRDLPKPS